MFGKNNTIWSEFDQVLAAAGEIKFWWRDDDVRASKPKFCKSNLKFDSRLKRTLSLLQKFNIRGVFAVIPDKFPENGAKQIGLLKKYNALIAIHGLMHINLAQSGAKNEFPEGQDNQESLEKILDYKAIFEKIFGNLFLPVFIPPYNAINQELEQSLQCNGFRLISKRNLLNENKPHHIDIDFMDWQTYKMRKVQDILAEIIELIKTGKRVIGFNNHHRCINTFNRLFFRKLFAHMSKHHNVKWIMPL